MSVTIALAGNPNCGKTTLFNALTGATQYVGNWPGVTVEKKEGRLKGNKDVIIEDLPGIYSLSPYTMEEVVSRKYLITEKPDVIINIIDGTNLERNLYLTTQVLELGIPVLVAVNMMDLVRKSGNEIRIRELAAELGTEIMEISALKAEGIQELAARAVELAGQKKKVEPKAIFSADIEKSLASITAKLPMDIEPSQRRFFAVKLFERDDKIGEMMKDLPDVESVIRDLEKKEDDDAESIITNGRYEYISSIIGKYYKKNSTQKLSSSDKIDRFVTNRVLGLLIFAAVMFVVYYVSIQTVGTLATDWTNDVLFGEIIIPGARGLLEGASVAPWLVGLLVDGIISGVGAVLGFLPQMVVLFIFLAFLEECGYMARIAFIMDRIFRKFGLSGKSFIPILIGTGCGVPGVMASRTIENERDRRMTVITTTFIPCGAKLPIIALIAGALFPESGWVAPSAYFVGIAAIIVSGIILKKTKMFAGEPAPFVMELPAYHLPTPGSIVRSVWERASSFVKKAGTIILLATILVWFLSTFGVEGGAFGIVEDMDNSILALVGGVLAPIFAPLGWGNWRAAVAAVTGLIAKENVVGTFGVLYKFAEVSENGEEIWGTLSAEYSQASAYSLLLFNLLCAPCFAAIGAIKREMNNYKWTWYAIGYQCILAYVVSLCTFQIWNFIATGVFSIWLCVAAVLIIGFLYLLFRPYKEAVKLEK